MPRIALAAVAGALLVGCAAPIPLVRPMPAPPSVLWSEELAFDAGKTLTFNRADGETELVAGPGAWLIATDRGRAWVFENGVVVSTEEGAP
jgi:hypothetical protein